MTIRIAQSVHASHDVVNEAFLREFPEIEAVKADNLESLSDALEGAEIFNVYNSAFTPEFVIFRASASRSAMVSAICSTSAECSRRSSPIVTLPITNTRKSSSCCYLLKFRW